MSIDWLRNNFGSSYTIVTGHFDRETGYLISGKVGIKTMTLETSRNGKCNFISIESDISMPQQIQDDAERFFENNGCSRIQKNIQDGINDDGFYKLEFEGEKRSGFHTIFLRAAALGSYNGFGKYFPTYYRKTIHCPGL